MRGPTYPEDVSGPTGKKRVSPAVYRRRRLVLLLGLAVIVALVVWLVIAQPWRGATVADERPSPAPSTSSPAASPSPSATEPVAAATEPPTDAAPAPEATGTAKPCAAADVTVLAMTDAETYAAAQNPLLSISLTNNGATDCTINVGTTSQQFTIMSGNDTWWRSTDCQTEPSDMIVTLAAGQTVTSATPLTWDRTRSSVSTCADADRPRASGGGASYHLSVEIGGIPSDGSRQFFLN